MVINPEFPAISINESQIRSILAVKRKTNFDTDNPANQPPLHLPCTPPHSS